MSQVYIIADSHWGHDNVIKYCDRPYRNIEHMNEDLIMRWNNTVAKDDKVFHLGDFGFGSKEFISGIVSRLHGKITLIKGNHDNHGSRWYFECGFHEVCSNPVVYMNEFILSHKPFYKNYNGDNPMGNLFGHLHNIKLDGLPVVGSQHACLSAENIGYKPIKIDKVVSAIRKEESFV